MSNDRVTEEIWAMEAAYFANLYDADYEGVIGMVHDRFLAWPNDELHPIDREGSARFMRQLVPAPSPCKIDITREGIRVRAAVVLTQFTLRVANGDAGGRTKPRVSRITHTWVKDDGQWRLLGGMSCDRL